MLEKLSFHTPLMIHCTIEQDLNPSPCSDKLSVVETALIHLCWSMTMMTIEPGEKFSESHANLETGSLSQSHHSRVIRDDTVEMELVLICLRKLNS
jgi:hypothetical protein